MPSQQEKLEAFYGKFNENKRLDSRHGQVELRVTMHYIHEALEKLIDSAQCRALKILDIGAGPGRYSIPLCREGYDVTAVELVKFNLGILKKNCSEVHAMQGNALNLKKLSDDTFDLTLLFGPMYHLMTREEKLQALREAKRVTRPGGYILVAYIMNEYAVLFHGILENKLGESMEQGLLSDDFHVLPGEESIYDFVRLEDIDSLNAEAGLVREKIISPDGPVNYLRPYINRLSEADFERVVAFQLATCERPELIGAGGHTVDILRKPVDAK